MLLSQQEINKLKKGNWECYSATMIVEKRDGKEKIGGPGFIRQIDQNCFQITIFNLNIKGGDKEKLRSLLSGSKYKAGEIMPQSENYDLVTEGDWKSNRLSDPDIHYSEKGSIYTFYTQEIFRENTRNSSKSKAGVSFVAFREYKNYPCNKPILKEKYIKGDKSYPGFSLCVADTKSGIYDLRFYAHDGETILRLTSNRNKKRHNDKIEFRSIEALEYVLGDSYKWNLKTVWDSTFQREHIRLVKAHSKSYFNRPYCEHWSPGNGVFEMFWGLYASYLEYILTDKENGWSAFGVLLGNLIKLRTANTAFSAYILALCVAVEYLLHEHFIQMIKDTEREKLVKKLIEDVESFLEKSSKNQQLSDMIIDHTKRLMPGKETPKRALDRLIFENKILKKRKDAWENLRHKVTHGKPITINQENLNAIGDIEVLLHQLVFQCIGYEGKYNDYGVLDYPCKKYSEEL